MNLIQETRKAAITFKVRDNSNKQAYVMLVTWYNEALNNWWDNSLDTGIQNSIINHVEIRRIEEENGLYKEINHVERGGIHSRRCMLSASIRLSFLVMPTLRIVVDTWMGILSLSDTWCEVYSILPDTKY